MKGKQRDAPRAVGHNLRRTRFGLQRTKLSVVLPSSSGPGRVKTAVSIADVFMVEVVGERKGRPPQVTAHVCVLCRFSSARSAQEKNMMNRFRERTRLRASRSPQRHERSHQRLRSVAFINMGFC